MPVPGIPPRWKPLANGWLCAAYRHGDGPGNEGTEAAPVGVDCRNPRFAGSISDAVEKAQAPGGDLESVRGYASKALEKAAWLAFVVELWGDMGTQEIAGAAMANGIELARFYPYEAARLSGVETPAALAITFLARVLFGKAISFSRFSGSHWQQPWHLRWYSVSGG